MNLTHTVLALLVCANAWYAATCLPRYFSTNTQTESYAAAACLISLASALVTWRRQNVIRGVATGLAVLGGLIGLFWPAVNIVFQGVDGGGGSLYENAVFLCAVLSSMAALVGAAGELVRGPGSRAWVLGGDSGGGPRWHGGA